MRPGNSDNGRERLAIEESALFQVASAYGRATGFDARDNGAESAEPTHRPEGVRESIREVDAAIAGEENSRAAVRALLVAPDSEAGI